MSETARARGLAGLGWPATIVLLAACTVLLVSVGLRSSLGLFLHPISHDLGFGRSIFAFAIALQNLIWGASQPFAGALADRYGTARMVAIGSILYGAGLLLMSQASDLTTLTLSAGFLVGLGLSGTFTLVLAAMARAVAPEKRSWALGLGTAAGSLGQFIWVPAGQAFLQNYGWSIALVLLGLGAFVMTPLAAALAGKSDLTAVREQSLGQALREAARHPGYRYLNGGFFVCGFHVAFIATHLPAYLIDQGLDSRVGAWALALIGLFNIVGSYTAGVLGGRLSKKYLLSIIYTSRAIAIAAFVLVPVSTFSTLAFAAAIGLLWLSTVPLTTGLVGQIFGTRYLAILFGIVFFSHQIGAFLGIWLGGVAFDATGSYAAVWWGGVALGVVSALLHWPIDERPVAALARA